MSNQSSAYQDQSKYLKCTIQPLKKSNVTLLQESDIDKFVNKNQKNEHHKERESWSDCLFNIAQYKKTGNDLFLDLAINNFDKSQNLLQKIAENDFQKANYYLKYSTRSYEIKENKEKSSYSDYKIIAINFYNISSGFCIKAEKNYELLKKREEVFNKIYNKAITPSGLCSKADATELNPAQIKEIFC